MTNQTPHLKKLVKIFTELNGQWLPNVYYRGMMGEISYMSVSTPIATRLLDLCVKHAFSSHMQSIINSF
jgi:hypothetical protein